MTEDLVEEPVTPRPGLLRTIGVLNLVFGTFLALYGAAACYVLVPFLAHYHPFRCDPEMAQTVVNDMRREISEQIRVKEETATREEDRRRLRRTREELLAVDTDLEGRIDFRKINDDLPWLSRYLWASVLSGPVLNVLMIISGLGLVFLRGWGRTLALWVAALKLGRLVGLCLFLVAVVVPRTTGVVNQFARTDFGKAFVHTAMDLRDSPAGTLTAAPRLEADELARIISASGYGYAVMGLALGAIYPLVVLIVLNRKGVLMALRGARMGIPGEEGRGQ